MNENPGQRPSYWDLLDKKNSPGAGTPGTTKPAIETALSEADSKAKVDALRTPDLTEARRLFDLGFKMCKLKPLSKQPEGKSWQLNPIESFDDDAAGYGVMLAKNGLCSVDPDNVELSKKFLKALGFDLERIMAAGVRSASTRPGSGGRSLFKADSDLRRKVFSFVGVDGKKITALELRAHSANLQDVVPGLVYTGKDGARYTQRYMSDRRLDDAGDLPAEFLAWWRRLSTDLDFQREQQRIAGEALGIKPLLSVSGGTTGKTLAYPWWGRTDFNAIMDVQEILVDHGYTGFDGRFAPPSATGLPGVREIPGKIGLWQSDHASDPLFGTFDAWTAHVVLNHEGDFEAAVESATRALDTNLSDNWFVVLPYEPPEPTPTDPKRFTPIHIGQLAGSINSDYLIKGVLPRAELAVLYGPSTAGKSFVALDMCFAIARGAEWRGRRVKQGRVVYVCAEGAAGFNKRVKAYEIHNGLDLDPLPFVAIKDCPNFLGQDDVAVDKRIEEAGGGDLIVIDTFAQVTPGANENSSDDMGKALGACKRLHRTTGATVMVIHHQGKDASKGARGWSGLKAAADAELLVDCSEASKLRALTITKSKDGADGGVFPFRLKVIVIGVDADMDQVDSCVIEPTDEMPVRVALPRGKNERLVAGVIRELAEAEHGKATRDHVIREAAARMTRSPSGRDRRVEFAKKALDSLIEDAIFYEQDGEIHATYAT